MQRILKKDLNALAHTFNKTFGHPVTYRDHSSPLNETSIGHFYIEQAGQRYELCQIVSKTGGARDVFNRGHMSPRPLFDLMQAYLSGAHEQRRVIAKSAPQPQESQSVPS